MSPLASEYCLFWRCWHGAENSRREITTRLRSLVYIGTSWISSGSFYFRFYIQWGIADERNHPTKNLSAHMCRVARAAWAHLDGCLRGSWPFQSDHGIRRGG